MSPEQKKQTEDQEIPFDENTDLMDYGRQVGEQTTDQETGGGDEGDETSAPTKEPEVPSRPSFTHPQLQGRSEAEVEAYVKLLENTVQSQSRNLNELTERQNAPAPQPEPELSKDDFFDDPVASMRETIRRELREAVGPINQEIENMRMQGSVNSAWQQVAAKFDDFDQYRPAIEAMLNARNVPPSQITPSVIESLYYSALGYFSKHGGGPSPAPQAQAPVQPPRPNVPPQHRPSPAPMPNQRPVKRQLTEEERRLASVWGMSEDEYRNMQDADIESVVGGGK